jgi:hypothetical protein
LHSGSQQVEDALVRIKLGLRGSQMTHNDETGLRVTCNRLWSHMAATSQLTYYQYYEKQGKEATCAMEVLPDFSGRGLFRYARGMHFAYPFISIKTWDLYCESWVLNVPSSYLMVRSFSGRFWRISPKSIIHGW